MVDQNIRILAAIMFSDMVGYTAMMQEDEKKAKLLRDHHRRVLEQKILEHKGKVLQYYGDGTLTIFGSAIEAVHCAVEIQNVLQEEPKVKLRVGIHIGDIVYEDEGVYGDGVNVASRIQSLGTTGLVLISEKVYDEIRNQTEFKVEEIGEFELKNVRKPMEIYAVIPDKVAEYNLTELRKKSTTETKSVAVLPFVNMSAEIENEYFSDGITEEIINALTKISGLRVTSRTSSFAFKGLNEDIRNIGNRLNVSTVLEGSVRRAGSKVRITAQLINVKDGYHKWSEVYDRNFEDIFSLQDEISQTIALKLKEDVQIKPEKLIAEKPLVKSGTKNIEAYNLYLKGLYHWNRWTPKDIHMAIEYYEKSIALDLNYAKPYSGLSNCYSFLGTIGEITSEEAYQKARENAEKAEELDNEIVEPKLSLALVKMFYDWDFKSVGRDLEELVEKYPGYAEVHYVYGIYYLVVGKVNNAIAELEKSLTYNPLSLPVNNYLGYCYALAERYSEAITILKKVLENDPTFHAAEDNLGIIYLMQGKYEKALELFRRMEEKVHGHEVHHWTLLSYTYTKLGNLEEAFKYMNKVKVFIDKNQEKPLCLDLAIIYAGFNDMDNMFDYLNKGIEAKIGGIVFLRSHPAFIEFKNDPRFLELLNKIGN